MTLFRLRTLGGIALERQESPSAAQRKTLALLTLLAVSRHHGISRERVAAYLWPESDTERARGALKQALHVARRLLGSPDAILGTSELRLNPAVVESDVAAFLTALEEQDHERALALYRGPFLDGFHLPGAPEFEEWVSLQRDELARGHVSVLERVAAAAENDGRWEDAIEWLRRMQAADPLSGRSALRLMRALDAAGERGAALRCAQVHEALLRDQLDSPPDPAVAALAADLRAAGTRTHVDHAAASAPTGSPPLVAERPAAPEPVPPVPGTQGRKRIGRRIALAATAAAVVVVAVLLLDRGRRQSATSASGVDASVSVLPFANPSDDTAAFPLTTDAEARELYLRGRHAWKQRSREGIRQALVYFEGAIERDPAFAQAYAGLAATFVNCSNFGFCDVAEALARAEVAADRAIALDPDLAEGYATKGFVHASRMQFDASEEAFQRAIQLNPSLTWAHHYYTLLLLMQGRTDEALVRNRIALALDPLSLPANATRGIILLQRGDHAAAERELVRALALSPRFQLTLYYLGVTRAAGGRLEEAGQLLEQALAESPDFPGVQAARAFTLLRSRRAAAADSLVASLEQRARNGNPRDRVNLAVAYGMLGRLDASFDMLSPAELDVPSLVALRADPLLRPLRADPRYHALLDTIGADRPSSKAPGTGS